MSVKSSNSLIDYRISVRLTDALLIISTLFDVLESKETSKDIQGKLKETIYDIGRTISQDNSVSLRNLQNQVLVVYGCGTVDEFKEKYGNEYNRLTLLFGELMWS